MANVFEGQCLNSG